MKHRAIDLVLINPGGRERVYQSLGEELTAIEPPLWVRLIAGHARDRGLRIAIIDSEAEAISPDAVAAAVAELDPTLVCMVVFGHQPSASTQMMTGAREACAAIRRATPSTPILIVGGHVSALPELTLREEPVDFVCVGEGPATAVALVSTLRVATQMGLSRPNDESLAKVPGLVWWRGETAVKNPADTLTIDLDADLHGNVWDLLPMDRYRAHNWQCFGDLASRKPYASIYTSLGCPYRCVFCCINAPFGVNRYRMRKPESVVAEVKHLFDRYGIHTFKIVDEMFVLNDRHLLAICDGLIAAGLGSHLNIWAYARVDTVKSHLLERLRRAGFRWLALGIESGSSYVRDGAGKALRTENIVAIVRETQAADINVIGNYIFGLPDDDLKTMKETLDLALELNCEFANFYSAMAYPGSPLHTQALEKGWPLPEQWSGYSQHSYDCLPLPTAKLSAAEVLRFRDDAFHTYFSNPGYLEMISRKFGVETRHHVELMAQRRLLRRLFDEVSSDVVPRMPHESHQIGGAPMKSPLADIDVLILAGGLGSRLANVLEGIPKVLAPINDRPFLDYQLDFLAGASVRKAVLSLGHGAEMVLKHLAATSLPLSVKTVVEAYPLGTAGAIALARPTLSSDPVVVLNGDTWLEIDLAAMLAAHRASCDAFATLSCVAVDDARRYGLVQLSAESNIITGFIEKDSSSSAGLINGGAYLLSAQLLDALVVMPNLSLERDVLPHLPAGKLRAYIVPDANFLDIGTPESYARAAAHLTARNTKLSAAVRL